MSQRSEADFSSNKLFCKLEQHLTRSREALARASIGHQAVMSAWVKALNENAGQKADFIGGPCWVILSQQRSNGTQSKIRVPYYPLIDEEVDVEREPRIFEAAEIVACGFDANQARLRVRLGQNEFEVPVETIRDFKLVTQPVPDGASS